MTSPFPAVMRWTAERKREVVGMIFSGDATRDQVCAQYAISRDELKEWERSFRRCNNPDLLNAVAAALSDREGRTPRQVLIRVDGAASTTVRHALAQLVADGRAPASMPRPSAPRRCMSRSTRPRTWSDITATPVPAAWVPFSSIAT